MWIFIFLLAFIAMIAFFILAVISLFKRKGTTKRNVFLSFVCFVVMIVSANMEYAPSSDTPFATKTDVGEKSETSSPKTSPSSTVTKPDINSSTVAYEQKNNEQQATTKLSAKQAEAIIKKAIGLALSTNGPTIEIDGKEYYSFDPISRTEKAEGISYIVDTTSGDMFLHSPNGTISFSEYKTQLGIPTEENDSKSLFVYLLSPEDFIGQWANYERHEILTLYENGMFDESDQWIIPHGASCSICNKFWHFKEGNLEFDTDSGPEVFKVGFKDGHVILLRGQQVWEPFVQN
ncbi:hypothetical protein ACTID9_26385 [Brevibacillus fluminis]|uniref:hypothetical protein n=1 Tax=Brevibacillus fluminis TaxID=511487 RepID=UPI003F897541